MANVYNWQIERQMEYPYEGARPKRQFAAVFDLNKCIGCQTCTMACKTTWTVGKGQEYMQWNNVETKPYGGYPMGGDVRILEKLGPQPWEGKKYVGKTIFEAAPRGEKVLGYLKEELDWTHSNAGEDEAAGTLDKGAYFTMPTHDMWFFYLPRISQKCIGCYPAVEQGMQPRCVTTCIGKIRLMGFLSKPDEVKPHVPMDF